MKTLLLFLIRLYQIALSPFVGDCCKFWPTCSDYGREAVEKYGAAKGGWLTFRRVLKCNPFHRGGSDPVP